MNNSQDLTDYDKFDYDYSKYWDDRKYEHMAEQYAFSSLIKNVEGNWFIDIGGSYGRHLNIYQENFTNKIICDYSIKSLEKAKQTIAKNKAKNVFLVAANAYNLPFKNNAFDCISLIRVIHHIEDVPKLIKEISRINSKSGYFFLEYANKNNIKAVMRALFKLNVLFPFNKDPLKQETKGSCEGTDSKTEGIIFNFHPKWIKEQIVSHGYRTLNKRSVSFLRIPKLKRTVNPNFMVKIETLLQNILGFTNLSPSTFLKLRKHTGKSINYDNIENILACPKCQSDLYINKSYIKCDGCRTEYKIRNGIFDLRYPKTSS